MEQTFLNLVHWKTTITWKDEETKEVNKMDTTFYITDTPGPAILGLPSCSRLRIVNLNCSVQLRKHGQPIKTCKERKKVKQDMKNLKENNSKDDLIKAYPDQFEGIGKFLGTYHIYLKEDAIPVVHTPRKCSIAIWPFGRQETGQTTGARSHCPGDGTNGFSTIISLLMESRW